MRGCLGAMFGDLLNKLSTDMKKVGNGPYDRSQIWDRIDARFFWSQGVVVAAFMAVWVWFV